MLAENITKKQHFVPQFYLKRFADPKGFLQIFDVKNKRLATPRTTSGVGYKQYFYAVKTGVPDDISQHIEKWLQGLEDAISRELPRIIAEILNDRHINDNDRYILSSLMSMLWLRSPGMRNHLNAMETDMTKQIMRFYAPARADKYEEKTGKQLSNEERSKIIETMETGNYELQFNNAQHLKFMTETMGFGGPGFTNMFFGQKWKIYIARGKKRFITSDTPIVEWWLPPQTFYGASFLERNKYFALTPEIFFELTYPMGSTKIKHVTIFENEDKLVAILNTLLAAHCQEFVYSGDRTLLQSILSGRANPGIIERDYYERFERPWEESRRLGRV